MAAFQLSDVAFEREFESHDENGNVSPVKIGISQPRYMDTHRWECHVQIVGIGHEKLRLATGLDSIDAMLTALKLAHALLLYFAGHDHKRITWLTMADLGLPPFLEEPQ